MKMKRKKAAIGIVIAIIIGAVVVGLLIYNSHKSSIDVQLIDKSTSEYLVMGIPENFTFHVNKETQNNEQVQVYGINGKIVNTQISEKGDEIEVKSPAGGYEPGGVYTLDITNVGTFNDEGLKSAKKLMFVIKKKNESNVIYTENVKELQESKVTVSDNGITIAGSYKNGDIILVDANNDGIEEMYKLSSAKHKQGQTSAEYSNPEANEVYKEIDVFFYDSIDMDNVVVDQEKLYGNLKETGILDIVFDDVYAAYEDEMPEIKFDVKGKGDDSSYAMKITVKWPEKPVKLIIACEVGCKTFYKNKENTVVLNNSFSVGGNVKISVEGKNGEVKEEEIKKAIDKFVSLEGAKTDNMDYRVPIVPIKIPIYGPIYLDFELGMKGSLDMSGKMDFAIRNKVVLTEGIVYEYTKTKVIKKYCEVEPILDASLSLEGKAYAFAGFYANGGVVVPFLITVEANGQVGPYFESKGCLILQDVPKKPKVEGYYDFSTGIMYDASINIKLLKRHKIKIPLIDDKLCMWEGTNGEKLKDVDINESYTLLNDGIQIGELHATYHDILENEDNVETLEEYELYVDGEAVDVKAGSLAIDKGPGEYTFEVKWKKEGKPYNYKRKVKVEEDKYDPQRIAFLTDYIWKAGFSVTNGGMYYIRFNKDGTVNAVHANTGECSYGVFEYSNGVLILSVNSDIIEVKNEKFRGDEESFISVKKHESQDTEINYSLERIEDKEEYFMSMVEVDMNMATNFNMVANVMAEDY